ncbi:type I glutamate--ammonia ligase [Helicovermis profundi]|uniref:glutamine synthetase n=1 Tax=Helicovermis profundi TaxID=3065157 RepID=A0AAU9E316_9FIRM|nr:glutamine synthetase [Clostridia bacterium S502]
MKELIYYINPKKMKTEEIKKILEKHREIKFVSLISVDLGNNHTDERIPIENMLNDINAFLTIGAQTDGSSVNLPGIAEINNAKVDLIPDLNCKWFIDYNSSNIDESTNLPTGTLQIPSFLKHESGYVDSRSVLKRAEKYFNKAILSLLKDNPYYLNLLGLKNIDEISSVELTSATELEFWVKTPDHRSDIEKLTTSQTLKEQYWKRTIGPVRTALEQSLESLNKFGYEAEMGHKEVGGVPAKLAGINKYSHIMEQLEIDWKFDNVMQTADNEMMSKDIIREVFVKHGLDITFDAKPIEGVAGSGEHHHVGVALKLVNGKTINLFSPINMEKEFLNPIGLGALMGILKNYEIINPFVTSSNDAFNRLKVGFEAPICTVCSLGHSPETPSRNRTVLIGLVRDINSPLATRFELRSPNPSTNTYLTLSSVYLSMLDGIESIIENKMDYETAYNELNKENNSDSYYLEKNRKYRSEEDVFEFYSEEERNKFFGKPPRTVFENISSFDIYKKKIDVLTKGNVFTKEILNSYKQSITSMWTTQLKNRILNHNINLIRRYKKLHGEKDVTDLDIVNWEKINSIRHNLMKDSLNNESLFTKISKAIDSNDFEKVSDLQIKMNDDMISLKDLYQIYKHNLLEFVD